MDVASFTKSGSKSKSAPKLPKDIFEIEVTNHQLLKQAYEVYLANGRTNLAKTKDRSEVRGGGRKPWRQKGTGRARHGSIRSPIWRTGGVTFGPQGNENYSKKISLKAKRQAIRQALSLAAKDGELIIIDSLEFKDGRTKSAIMLLEKLQCTRNTVLVVDDKSDEVVRAVRNLPNVSLITAKYLNVFTILNADHIVVTNDALKVIESWLGEGVKDE